MIITKMHGLGNDFIITEETPTDERATARSLCRRRLSVGADGLVLLSPSNKADYRMRIINSDGSEAEMCGNAVRCAAAYLYDRGLVKKTDMKIETLAGIVKPQIILEDGSISGVRVNMGQPSFEPSLIPANVENPLDFKIDVCGRSLKACCLLMGVPHAVLFADSWSESEVLDLGAAIESHPLFPRKINVNFAQPEGDSLRVRTFERGAGRTLACGTGSCAVGAAAFKKELHTTPLCVLLDAGELTIEQSAEGDIYMTGPAAYVFDGQTIGE